MSEGVNATDPPGQRNGFVDIANRYGLAILNVAVATGLSLLLDQYLRRTQSALFLAAVVFTATYGGFWPAMLGTVLSLLALDYFFFEPLYRIEPSAIHIPTLLLFTAVSAAVSALVTARQRAEQQLRTTNEALQHEIQERERAQSQLALQAEELSRSNQELELFAFAASHDLKAPLRNIQSYAELLSKRESPEERAEYLSFIMRSAETAGRLVSDLLAYSRLNSSPDIAAWNLSEILRWAMMQHQAEILETGATVNAGTLPTVRGNQTQLMQLFQNLIGNALKYRSEKPPEITIACTVREHEWLLSFRDNGIGFDPKYAQDIFRAFRRLHGPEVPGTGLGLATCQKIVTLHGGRIWAESVPGEGATFFLTIPAS